MIDKVLCNVKISLFLCVGLCKSICDLMAISLLLIGKFYPLFNHIFMILVTLYSPFIFSIRAAQMCLFKMYSLTLMIYDSHGWHSLHSHIFKQELNWHGTIIMMLAVSQEKYYIATVDPMTAEEDFCRRLNLCLLFYGEHYYWKCFSI